MLRTVCVVLRIVSAIISIGPAIADEPQRQHADSDVLYQECVSKSQTGHYTDYDADRELKYQTNTNEFCLRQVQNILYLRDVEYRRQALSEAQTNGQRIIFVSMSILLFATFSGIILAGIQIISSYRLMSQGYRQLGTDSDLVIKYNSVALRSSIAGVTIFAISMLFFAFFIYVNNTIQETPLSFSTPPAQFPPAQNVPLSSVPTKASPSP
jgi:hypothetical protein